MVRPLKDPRLAVSIGFPSRRIEPLTAAFFLRSPDTAMAVSVLPLPDSPISAVMLPSGTVNDASWTILQLSIVMLNFLSSSSIA